MAEKVLSIEIGPHLTKVVETERKSTNVVYNAFYFETPEDTFENGNVKSNPTFKLRLEDGLKEHGIKTKKVIFVIQATNIGNKEEEMPKMKDNKIKEYINTNSGTFFPNSGDNYKFTYRNNGTNANGQVRAQLFAIPNNIIKGYETLAEFCGLTLTDIELVENGIAKVIRENYPVGTTVSINVESICTYLTIVKGGDIMLQRMIPFGIDEALLALKEENLLGDNLAFDKVFEKACSTECFYKRLDGPDSKDEEDKVKDAATEEVRFVIGNLTRFIDYYMSQHSDEDIDKVIISGLATYLKGFPALLANELNRELVLADNTVLRDVANKNNVANLGIYLSTLSSSANANNTVIESSKGKKGLTFDKSDLVKADDDFSVAKKALIGASIIALVLILAGVGLKVFFSIKKDNINDEIDSLQEAKEINDKYQKAKVNYDAAANIEKLSSVANDAFLNLLGEMESALPSDVVVTAIDADSEAVAVDVASNSKASIAEFVSSFRTFNSVTITDTIDIKSTTNDVGLTQYTATIKATYKTDSTN